MTPEEIIHNYMLGTIFSIDTTIEYIESLQTMTDKKDSYDHNKFEDAIKSCGLVKKNIERKLYQGRSEEQKQLIDEAIDYHKTLVYDFFLLDVDKQRRVRSLINKMK
jgi:hypothetical protein